MNFDLNSGLNSGELGLDPKGLPRHVAIIMDGNGRWAEKRTLGRIRGHRAGVESVRDIVRYCREIGIGVVTLYAFSTENWKRHKAEVLALMSLLKEFLVSELPEFMRNGIRINTIGEIERFSDDVLAVIRDIRERTSQNKNVILNLALSYGGRDEIVRATRAIARSVRDGLIDPSQIDKIDETLFSDYLDTRGMPDPDLLIRTSGEIRVSNFLLWQIAYAEIFVTETLWPDFRRDEFCQILREYQKRERRFGLTRNQVEQV